MDINEGYNTKKLNRKFKSICNRLNDYRPAIKDKLIIYKYLLTYSSLEEKINSSDYLIKTKATCDNRISFYIGDALLEYYDCSLLHNIEAGIKDSLNLIKKETKRLKNYSNYMEKSGRNFMCCYTRDKVIELVKSYNLSYQIRSDKYSGYPVDYDELISRENLLNSYSSIRNDLVRSNDLKSFK